MALHGVEGAAEGWGRFANEGVVWLGISHRPECLSLTKLTDLDGLLCVSVLAHPFVVRVQQDKPLGMRILLRELGAWSHFGELRDICYFAEFSFLSEADQFDS